MVVLFRLIGFVDDWLVHGSDQGIDGNLVWSIIVDDIHSELIPCPSMTYMSEIVTWQCVQTWRQKRRTLIGYPVPPPSYLPMKTFVLLSLFVMTSTMSGVERKEWNHSIPVGGSRCDRERTKRRGNWTRVCRRNQSVVSGERAYHACLRTYSEMGKARIKKSHFFVSLSLIDIVSEIQIKTVIFIKYID